jgi:AraC family transcriptional regulator
VSSGGLRSAAQVRADRPRGTLLASSSRWVWAGPFQADEYAAYPGVIASPNDHIAISATLRPSGYLRETRRGRTFEGPVGAGDAVIIPSREVTEWTGAIPAHVRMAVAPSLVAEAADDIHGAGARRARIADVLHTADPVLARLAELIVAELRAPDHPAQRLMFDSLAAALVAHLLRAYSGLDEPRAALPALTRRGVGRAVDYIHQHPAAAPGLAELAAVAGLSQHHFARAFRAATGESPVRYAERVRIEHATRLLRSGSLPLAEVAAALGYSDQAHFTRRFRAHTGTTPGEFRGRRVLRRDG